MHFCSLSFKAAKSALFPRTSPRAPNKIDFPAPVYPVIIEKSVEKFISKDSISA